MANGLHTTIETLSYKLLERWVPKWYEAFSDNARGGFYERLGHSFKPVPTGQRRLLTQCRQLSLYSHALVQGIGRSLPGLDERFAFIVRSYHNPQSGGWHYSINDEGKVLDPSYDLYTQAFVIFALSHYYRASGDEQARELAGQALDFIDRHFRIGGLPGFAEALDDKLNPVARVRRHESHMHLLEACLFAAEISSDPAYRRMTDELVDLFLNHLYDRETGILSEYYTDDLRPQPENGHIILEPGHYCEWVWLLKKHAQQCGEPERYDELCKRLLEWASTKGWDSQYGGIYDELNAQGEVVSDKKRLWPLAEALKANALMLDSGVDKVTVKARIRQMVGVFRRHYMQERGFWTEWLRRDLTQETDYMPGTTPYHVYFGIMETREVIQARGRTRSLVAGPQMTLYSLRRRISNRIRDARYGLKALRS